MTDTRTAWEFFEESVAEHISRRRDRPSTFDLLRHIHPDDSGYLELRAFGDGAPARAFVPLPMTSVRYQEVQAPGWQLLGEMDAPSQTGRD